MSDEDFEIELTDEDYQMMAANLPTYPPLSDEGEATVEDFHDDLTSEEMKKLYAAYQALGGQMALYKKDAFQMGKENKSNPIEVKDGSDASDTPSTPSQPTD